MECFLASRMAVLVISYKSFMRFEIHRYARHQIYSHQSRHPKISLKILIRWKYQSPIPIPFHVLIPLLTTFTTLPSVSPQKRPPKPQETVSAVTYPSLSFRLFPPLLSSVNQPSLSLNMRNLPLPHLFPFILQ